MKKIFLLISVMTLSLSMAGQHASAFSAFSAGSYLNMDMAANSGFTTDIWQCSNDDRASQFFVPIQGEMENDTWSFSLFTAYVYTSFKPNDGDSRSLSCITDTKLNISYSLMDRLPVDMMFGLDFNLPTGKTRLDEDEMSLIMDSDLVSINTFGEGFNVNPTLSVTKEWHKWTGSLGFGFVFRGAYDFSSALVDYNPGDIYNVTSKIDYAYSSGITMGMLIEYAFYDIDKAEGKDYYQDGNFLLLGLAFSYAQSNWDTSVSLYHIIRGKSKFIDDNVLLTEDKKSNGDESVAGLSFRYVLSPQTTLNSILQLSLVNANDYPEDSPYYESERQKVLLGCGIRQTQLYFPSLEGHLFIKGFLLTVDKLWPMMDENLDYKGLSIEADIYYQF